MRIVELLYLDLTTDQIAVKLFLVLNLMLSLDRVQALLEMTDEWLRCSEISRLLFHARKMINQKPLIRLDDK